jgi:hypothetical protein
MLGSAFQSAVHFSARSREFLDKSRSTTHLRNRNAVALAYMGGSLLAAQFQRRGVPGRVICFFRPGLCVPSASRGHEVERAANPLHRAGINAKTLGDPTDTFASGATFQTPPAAFSQAPRRSTMELCIFR